MKIKIVRGLGAQPIVVADATMVLVEDRFGNIVSLACELSPEAIECSHAQDPHHNRILHALGLNKTVVCDQLELDDPPAGAQLILPGR